MRFRGYFWKKGAKYDTREQTHKKDAVELKTYE